MEQRFGACTLSVFDAVFRERTRQIALHACKSRHRSGRARGDSHARKPIPRKTHFKLQQIALRACDSRCRGWWARGDSHARRPIPCRACLELQQSMLRACGSLCRGGQTHGNSRTRSPVPHKASDRSRQIALQGCAPHRRGSRRRKRRWVAPLAAGVSWGGEQPARLAGATQDERDAESR